MQENEGFRKWFQKLSVFWKVVAIFGVFYFLRWIIEGDPIGAVSVITTFVWAVLISVIFGAVRKLRKDKRDGKDASDKEGQHE